MPTFADVDRYRRELAGAGVVFGARVVRFGGLVREMARRGGVPRRAAGPAGRASASPPPRSRRAAARRSAARPPRAGFPARAAAARRRARARPRVDPRALLRRRCAPGRARSRAGAPTRRSSARCTPPTAARWSARARRRAAAHSRRRSTRCARTRRAGRATPVSSTASTTCARCSATPSRRSPRRGARGHRLADLRGRPRRRSPAARRRSPGRCARSPTARRAALPTTTRPRRAPRCTTSSARLFEPPEDGALFERRRSGARRCHHAAGGRRRARGARARRRRGRAADPGGRRRAGGDRDRRCATSRPSRRPCVASSPPRACRSRSSDVRSSGTRRSARGLVALLRCALLDGTAEDLLAWLRTPGLLHEPALADRLEAARPPGGRPHAPRRPASCGRRERWPLDAIDRVAAAHERSPRALVRALSAELAALFAAPYRAAGRDPRRRAGRWTPRVLPRRAPAHSATSPSSRRPRARARRARPSAGGARRRPARRAARRRACTVSEPLSLRARRVRALFLCGLQENALPAARPTRAVPRRRRAPRARRRVGPAAAPPRGRRSTPSATSSTPRSRARRSASSSRGTTRATTASRPCARCSSTTSPRSSDRACGSGADAAGARRRSAGSMAPSDRRAPARRGGRPARATARRRSRRCASRGARVELRRADRVVGVGDIEAWAGCPVKWLVDRRLRPGSWSPTPRRCCAARAAHAALEATLRAPRPRERQHGRSSPDRLPRRARPSRRRSRGSPGASGCPPTQRRVRALAAAAGGRPAALPRARGARRQRRTCRRTSSLASAVRGRARPAARCRRRARSRGRIDRIDVAPAAAARSSTTTRAARRPTARSWVDERKCQVALYLLAVRELLGLEPAGGLYQPLGARPAAARRCCSRTPIPAWHVVGTRPPRRARRSTRCSTASSRRCSRPSPSCAPARSRPRPATCALRAAAARIPDLPERGAERRSPRSRRGRVARREGSLLLAASAGSGQDVGARRALRARRCSTTACAPAQILAITFTEKAAGELRARVRARFLELGEREAARETEGAWIVDDPRLLHPRAARPRGRRRPGPGVRGARRGTIARALRDDGLAARARATWLDDGARRGRWTSPPLRRGPAAGGDRRRPRRAAQRAASTHPGPAADPAASRRSPRRAAAVRSARSPAAQAELAARQAGCAASPTARGGRARRPRTFRDLQDGARCAGPAARAYRDAVDRLATAERDERAAGVASRCSTSCWRPTRPPTPTRKRGRAGAGLRRPRAARPRPAARRRGASRVLRRALRAGHGRRVPGHEPAPARAARPRWRRDDRSSSGTSSSRSTASATPTSRSSARRARRSASDGATATLADELPLAAGDPRRGQRRVRAALRRRVHGAASPGADPGPRPGRSSSCCSPTADGLGRRRPRRPAARAGLAPRRGAAARPARRASSSSAAQPRRRTSSCSCAPSADLPVFERALQDVGLPTLAVGGRGYWGRQVVRDLCGWLGVLANPRDEIALLRRPGLAAGRARQRTRWRSSRRPARPVRGTRGRRSRRRSSRREGSDLTRRLGPDDRERLARVRRALRRPSAPSRRAWGSTSCIERVVAAAGYDLHVLSLPSGERRLANVHKLLRLAADYEREHGRDVRGFVDLANAELEAEAREADAPVELGDLDAVRLMTIHAAKGLEFPVVCVADLGRRGRADDGRPARRRRPGRPAARRARRLRASQALAYQRAARARRGGGVGRGGARSLYVALTRAHERLIVSGSLPRREVARRTAQTAPPLAWLGPRLVPGDRRGAPGGAGPRGRVDDARRRGAARPRDGAARPDAVGTALRRPAPAGATGPAGRIQPPGARRPARARRPPPRARRRRCPTRGWAPGRPAATATTSSACSACRASPRRHAAGRRAARPAGGIDP